MAELSIFGQNIEALQILIDTRQEKFNKPWYVDYFDWDTPQIGLDYSSVLGSAVITAAASIVDRNAETPLRSREALAKIMGEIPAMKVMLPMNENQYRHYLALANMPNVKDGQKKMQALKLIWDDVKKVTEAIHNRLDVLVLQAVSTGAIDININNNPDGVVFPNIDLLMPSENKKQVGTAWSETSATPLQDIMRVVNEGQVNGYGFAKILIDSQKFAQMMRNQEVKDTLGAFFGLTKTATNSQTAPLTLDRLNQYMKESNLPIFEVVNKRVAIEKNGKPTIINPFEAKTLSFIPDGKLGVIKNALAVEELNPVENITYANSGRILISKWKQNEPFREFTKSECNAFPVVESINNIFLLKTES